VNAGLVQLHADPGAFPWLVADIGGTNARFGWVGGAAGTVEHVRKLSVPQHAGPAEAVRTYLGELADTLGNSFQAPRRGAFAVASTIAGDRVALTNSHWDFSTADVRAELGLDDLVVMNDFEALALSLPHLQASQLRCHGAAPQPHGTLCVIGPGTGLGVAGITETARGWVALPGEGGHATLAPIDDFEADLLSHVRRHYDHVSAERLLSGIGLPVLHGAVAAVTGAPTGSALPAEEIVARGLSGQDACCRQTLETFCALLGSFAGNVALTLGARGGVYIGGGIVPRLGDLFFASAFRARFEAKGRFSSYLQPIPTALITDTLVALTGAAAAIRQRPAGR